MNVAFYNDLWQYRTVQVQLSWETCIVTRELTGGIMVKKQLLILSADYTAPVSCGLSATSHMEEVIITALLAGKI